MGYPLKKHAHGFHDKTVCGKRKPQIPNEALTGRAEWVTCKACSSILAKSPESIPVHFRPAPRSLPKGDRDDAA